MTGDQSPPRDAEVDLNEEHRDALAVASQALGAELKAVAKLNSDSKLVLRCTADTAHRSVIVRQLPPGEGEQHAHREAWYFNEWAGLKFLTEIGGAFAPRVYAGDPPHRLLVLEDLGDHPPLMDALQKGNPTEAAEGLTHFLSLLGQMHAATYGKEDRFQAQRAALQAPEPATEDAKLDLRDFSRDFARHLTRLNIPIPDGFAAELAEVSAAIHDDAAFRVYTHSDAGPHNVQHGQPLRLFDFEFAFFRSGMIDATGPRMAFPSAYHGRPSPPAVVRRAERAYREALATTVPAARDDRLFHRALLHGCAHWTFAKLPRGLDEWLVDHEGDAPPPFSDDQQYFAQQNLTRFNAFAAICEEFDGLPALRQVALALADRHRQAQPDLEPFPLFAAFAED